MKTMTMRTMVVLAALVVAGCGADGAGLGEDGTGGMAASTGTGGAIGAGGQGGALPTGTGGAAVATGGTIGSEFTRADHDMCMAWEVCPADVIAPLAAMGRVGSQQCKTAFDGGRLTCGACMLRSTAALFIGRCLAPFVVKPGTGDVGGNFVTSTLSDAQRREMADTATEVVPGGWALCTGDTATPSPDGLSVGVNAKTVCKD